MTDKLDATRLYVESINREESLLDFDETQFPLLQTMFQTKDPYDKLWTTAIGGMTAMRSTHTRKSSRETSVTATVVCVE